MHTESNASRELADESTVGERVKDALDTVVLHGHEEAGAHLVLELARVHQGGGGVCELLLTHEILSLQDAV